MKVVSVTLITMLAMTVAHPAYAYCRAPGAAPQAPRSYDKPTQPNCMRNARFDEEPDCDQYELDRYQREVERYLEKLQDYAEEARDYAQAAETYAQCEAAEISETLN